MQIQRQWPKDQLLGFSQCQYNSSQSKNKAYNYTLSMANIIQNIYTYRNLKPDQTITNLQGEPRQLIQNLLNSTPLQRYQKTFHPGKDKHRIQVSIFFESLLSLQAVAHVIFDMKQGSILTQMNILRKNELLKMHSKGKANIMSRLIQRVNLHLAYHNASFSIDTNNGRVAIRNPTISYQKCITPENIKHLSDLMVRNFQLVQLQVIYLIQSTTQTFLWEIYAKDPKYVDRIHMEMIEIMKIRELIAISSISFQDNPNDAQGKYLKNRQLVNFLNHRENMVNPSLKKQCMIGEQMRLYNLFLEPFFFAGNPLSLQKMQSDFVKQFEHLFYKFQARNMPKGDNPYLFNTIVIKNEEKVELSEPICEGGFSELRIGEMEIAYTQSQNLVLEMPKLASLSPKQKSWADEFECANNKKIIYIAKIIAVKMNKSQQDYQKIKHEKIIVQNFRTTASPFILKYYNCTQKRFKYRQYLLMDYLGPTLTLSEYNALNSSVFSMHSKMHVFIHLANALTFLQKQMVVHMDLSTHNIMICKDLLVKIIDFGQAYHPYLDSNKTIKYVPGHTLPYCPPENFNRLKKFTSKSDVFSFGMILFRTLFNDFPFASSSELKQKYMQRQYLQRWMFAPERVGAYGYEPQLLLIVQLISRCFSYEESNRPHPYWLYVILNKLLLTLK